MKHPTDEDLEFLKSCSKEELEFLVKLITEKGGRTSQLKEKRAYVANVADPTKYVDEIIEEIQRYAGNTVCNLFRSHGVAYREALKYTLKTLAVGFDKRLSLGELERLLLRFGLERYLNKMKTDKCRQDFCSLLENIGTLSAGVNGLDTGDFAAGAVGGAAGAVGGAAMGGSGVAGGVAGGAAKLATGVGTIVGGGSMIVAAAVGAAVGIAGWGGFYLSGPANRVVIPAVIYIAKLRQCMIEQKRI
jgi:uncharacterized protein YaaW (UPF0174 family)